MVDAPYRTENGNENEIKKTPLFLTNLDAPIRTNRISYALYGFSIHSLDN